MEISKIVNKTEAELKDNYNEWYKRWNGWAEKLHDKDQKKFISEARATFNERAPLRIYLPMGKAMESKNKCNFSIRYQGADIAQILVEKEGKEPKLIISNQPNGKNNNYLKNNREKFGIKEVDIVPGIHSWTGKTAKKFRSIFSMHAKNNSAENEHNFESLILDEMELKTKDKFNGTLQNIQPVELYGRLRFQMKVPLSGNNGIPKYSSSGGGIDILARVGNGSNTNLAIVELKKEGKGSYKKALAQAIMYSIGTIKILRDNKMGRPWWELFGFERTIPDVLKIFSLVMIPESLSDEYMKERNRLGLNQNSEIKIGSDIIQCGHIFFKMTNGRIMVTETSENLKHLS